MSGVLESAGRHLQSLEGHVFDVLTVSKPVSVEAAVNLARVISKLSPLLGNMIEMVPRHFQWISSMELGVCPPQNRA
jgi:hypothetical protein